MLTWRPKFGPVDALIRCGFAMNAGNIATCRNTVVATGFALNVRDTVYTCCWNRMATC